MSLAGHVVHLDADPVGVLEEHGVVAGREAAVFGRMDDARLELARDEVVRLLGRLAEGESEPEAATDLPTHEWLRLGCDDLRTWYMEAAQGQPGRGSAAALRDWFWRDTAAARLIGSAATTLLAHPSPILRFLAGRAMVPRMYFPLLMPTTDPAAWETEGGSR